MFYIQLSHSTLCLYIVVKSSTLLLSILYIAILTCYVLTAEQVNDRFWHNSHTILPCKYQPRAINLSYQSVFALLQHRTSNVTWLTTVARSSTCHNLHARHFNMAHHQAGLLHWYSEIPSSSYMAHSFGNSSDAVKNCAIAFWMSLVAGARIVVSTLSRCLHCYLYCYALKQTAWLRTQKVIYLQQCQATDLTRSQPDT